MAKDDDDILRKLKAVIQEKDDEKDMSAEDSAALVAPLTTLFESYTTAYELAPGMLVTWKPGLKNRKRPHANEPAVIISLLDSPIFGNTDESGSSYFREPLDLVAGIIEDEKFLIFHFDSRRFMPFSSES